MSTENRITRRINYSEGATRDYAEAIDDDCFDVEEG